MDKAKETRIAAFERALGLDPVADETDAAAAERVRMEARLAPLADLLPPVAPSPGLFSRIVAAAGIDMPLAGFHVVRRDEGEWQTVAPGVETKLLWHDHATGRRTFMLRMQAGAVMIEHDHRRDEELLVIEGDMVVNGVAFGPGDFHVGFAGSHHPHVTTRFGCLCLVSLAA